MKKSIKILILIIISFILLIIIDLIAIFTINRPLFAIKKDNVYKGIIYDVYDCAEYAIPLIKNKDEKFSCINFELKTVKNIVDESKEIKDFECREVLEGFYQDKTYEYFFSCMKSEYIKVIYSDNSKESVKNALKNNRITITDLDKYNIDYYKYEK